METEIRIMVAQGQKSMGMESDGKWAQEIFLG